VDPIDGLQLVEECLGITGGQVNAAMCRSRKAPHLEPTAGANLRSVGVGGTLEAIVMAA
jgi:hypothetical protein